LLLLLFLWLYTGGVAVQRVQRFDSTANSRLNQDEDVRISLGGSVSQVHIPFLFSRYSEKGPFRLALAYHNYGEKTCREVCLHSVRLHWDGGPPVELVEGGRALVLPVDTQQHPNSTLQGVVWSVTHSLAHRFQQHLDIPFGEGKLVRCEIDIEFVGEGVSKRLKFTRDLQGHTMDFIKSYWEHLADC
jgi:hypothetical protein